MSFRERLGIPLGGRRDGDDLHFLGHCLDGGGDAIRLETRANDSDPYLRHDPLISWFGEWRVEFDVAAPGAPKRAEWYLLLRAKFDPSEKTLTLRRTRRPACQEDLPVSNIGNVPKFHRLLAFRTAWRGVRHVSADSRYAHAGCPGASGMQPTHLPGVMT
jgi:hypothetical protein